MGAGSRGSSRFMISSTNTQLAAINFQLKNSLLTTHYSLLLHKKIDYIFLSCDRNLSNSESTADLDPKSLELEVSSFSSSFADGKAS